MLHRQARMASNPDASNLPIGNLEELEQIHKKERKDLQSKIQALKKSCAKGDKKKKKEVAEEIVKLEADLEKRQQEQISQFESSQPAPVAEVAGQIDGLALEEESSKGPRLTKAQKRRDKKAEKDKEREIQIAQQEQENKFGPRNREEVAIKELLKARKLQLFEVPSNGDCLYLAIEHQLKEKSRPSKDVSELRRLTSAYLRSHEDDLRPFTCNPSTGCEFSSEEYSKYCDRVEKDSSEWGGQLELQALSEALSTPIEVLQAEGAPVILGENHRPTAALVLTYHRHAFGLGEHYNSVAQYCAAKLLQAPSSRAQLVAFPGGEERSIQVASFEQEERVVSQMNYPGSVGNIMSLSYAGAGRVLALFEAGDLLLWDLRSPRKPQGAFRINLGDDDTAPSAAMCLAFSAPKSLGVVGSSDNTLHSFALDAGGFRTLPSAKITNEGTNHLCFRPDQKILAAACWDSKVRLFSTRSIDSKTVFRPLAVLPTLVEDKSFSCVTFSDKPVESFGGETILAAAGDACSILLWDIYN
ncbi:Hypothetical predicted protein [Cloeon dipterum]|uniref:OTU domain-containing protein n=1 Tax=Cloeon dipterum TaxID=197152 RepID=A0A8S1CBR2_9INSE|nr:Hypothetical predicted protein [Cloeon dipterum]